jgi:hypothetical protein
MGEERNVYRVLVGKPQETTLKTKEQIGGWDQNGCWGD